MESTPQTLLEVIQYFAVPGNCIKFLAAKRWPDGAAVCPICGRKGAGFLEKQQRWQCSARHPKRQFSIKVGTIFEDSPLGLDKWLPAMWLIGSNRNGISSWELHRAIGVTQKTAWFMLHRIRTVMQDESTGGKLGGPGAQVEVDETFIGGKARNMHPERKLRAMNGMKGGPGGNKTIVLGILERAGNVRATVISDRKKNTLGGIVSDTVEHGSQLMTDEFQAGWWKGGEYEHKVINHLVSYVDGNCHTNGLENFWALLKRQIKGTYVSVEPFHLFRYVDEEAFRYNNRLPMNDGDRFNYLVRKIVGKHLTYKELIGKEAGARAEAF